MQFWERTIEGLQMTIEFYKANSKDIDLFVNLDNKNNQAFKMVHTETKNRVEAVSSSVTPDHHSNSPDPALSPKKSFFSFFSKKSGPSDAEKEFNKKKREQVELRNKYKASLTINESYNSNNSDGFSKLKSGNTNTNNQGTNGTVVSDSYLGNYLTNGNGSKKVRSFENTTLHKSISVVVPGSKSSSLMVQENALKRSSTYSKSLSKNDIETSRTIIPVPTDSIYWIAKRWNSVSFMNSDFVDVCIGLLEDYLK
ncbi:hypothetical protein AYI68_g1259 [Smittium mucronatum]|uniref:Uncharacterized protein n=1 Tax=Smittium mucronatum TaxID=133383 RepID=A0A1R0H5X5_9FUNG|nr:hypothetical protein AYI68_g1259 [Smittium mucronatum]